MQEVYTPRSGWPFLLESPVCGKFKDGRTDPVIEVGENPVSRE
jgi:hypothetical protein